MPATPVRIFCDVEGLAPIAEWLELLEEKARLRCLQALRILGEFGHELRRPHADYLENDIYELRVKHGRVNLRMLYFFHGQEAVVVTSGFAKERVIPPREIEFARRCREAYLKNPQRHTFEG